MPPVPILTDALSPTVTEVSPTLSSTPALIVISRDSLMQMTWSPLLYCVSFESVELHMPSRRPCATLMVKGSSSDAKGQSPEPRQLIPKSRGRSPLLWRGLGDVEVGAASKRENNVLMAARKVLYFIFADAVLENVWQKG